jgi:hypothetical protein
MKLPLAKEKENAKKEESKKNNHVQLSREEKRNDMLRKLQLLIGTDMNNKSNSSLDR